MFEIIGQYAKAKVFTSFGLDDVSYSQIQNFLNHVAFEGTYIAIMPDVHAGKGAVVGFTSTLGDKIIPNVIGVDIGCFTGETKIPLLDGIQYSFLELLDKEFYVYSMNEELQIVPGKAKCIKTREKANLVEVGVSGGEIIRCTPDQRFMLIDGTYKEAKDLVPKFDSLMPLYRSYDTRDGYESIRSCHSKACHTHKMVAKHFLGDLEDGFVAHHKNELWFDNNPDNLEYTTWKIHSSNHATKRNIFASDDFKKKKRDIIKERGYTYNPKLKEKKQKVAIDNILTYMRNNYDEWKEKIKDNGKRGAIFLKDLNKTFVCEVCGRTCGNYGSYKLHLSKHKNHKVLFVRSIDLKEDVYCLQVEQYHNFALSCGVFVHNCGVLSYPIANPIKFSEQLFETIDSFIRNEIPSGFGTFEHASPQQDQESFLKRFLPAYVTPGWFENVNTCCLRTDQSINYVWNSLGSLGGGNHFIEINQDQMGKLWLVIHSGSRNFGLKVANYYQNLAFKKMSTSSRTEEIEKIKATKKGKEIQEAIIALKKSNPKVPKDLAYLEGNDKEDYLHDMNIAQLYAQLNRRMICARILSHCFYELFLEEYVVESVHNYIDLKNKIIRKGAISAQKDEKVLIPLNMAEGIVYGRGRGNPEWNYSAPHGAGRKMSRSKAKGEITLKEYQDVMKVSGVMSSSVLPSTLDEAPQAYKDSKKILKDIEDTVNVVSIMKPLYNFKAG